MANVNERVGAAIRGRRVELGLDPAILAERMGISRQQLYKFETGQNCMPLPRFLAALRALNTSADTVLLLAADDPVETTNQTERGFEALVRDIRQLSPGAVKALRAQVRELRRVSQGAAPAPSPQHGS